MPKKFSQLRAAIDADPQRRARVEQHKRAILDALALGEIRAARAATQQQLAAAMGATQANISRIERQDDLYLSTLRAYVEALGGRLEIAAVFDDQTIYLTESEELQKANDGETLVPAMVPVFTGSETTMSTTLGAPRAQTRGPTEQPLTRGWVMAWKGVRQLLPATSTTPTATSVGHLSSAPQGH